MRHLVLHKKDGTVGNSTIEEHQQFHSIIEDMIFVAEVIKAIREDNFEKVSLEEWFLNDD